MPSHALGRVSDHNSRSPTGPIESERRSRAWKVCYLSPRGVLDGFIRKGKAKQSKKRVQVGVLRSCVTLLSPSRAAYGRWVVGWPIGLLHSKQHSTPSHVHVKGNGGYGVYRGGRCCSGRIVLLRQFVISVREGARGNRKGNSTFHIIFDRSLAQRQPYSPFPSRESSRRVYKSYTDTHTRQN